MHIVTFTGGTVGAGHLMRGIAIDRALRRRGFRGEHCVLGPPLPFPVIPGTLYEPVVIEKDALVDPARAPTTALARRLGELAPDVLVVDMFWALSQHLLPAVAREAWLLVRAAPGDWLSGPVGLPFQRARWQRVIGIEPIAPAGVGEQLSPLVSVNRDELAARGELRERLGAPAGARLEVIVHAGKPGEIDTLRSLSPRAHVLDLAAPDALFPAARWLPEADRVVGGAGYNTFWEARWLGFHARSSLVPFARRIDDQALRATACAAVPMRENGADALASWLA